MPELPLGPWAKSLPPSSWGLTDREFLEERPRLSAFATPLLTLDRSALEHNVALMAAWSAARGLQLAPHGKTTMAPQLWRQLIDAGAWGITLATGWQVQFARSVGMRRILLANELVDPSQLRWLGDELADPGFEFACWADSVAAVEAMEAALGGAARPVDVIVELGHPGGRTGARGVDAALEVAQAIAGAKHVRLAGVGGYEGSYAKARTPEGADAVRRYLDDIALVHSRLDWQERPIITAGGSAWFDLVDEELGPLRDDATVILRSGAYQVHDSGFYAGITPLASLRAAMHGWSRVLSVPEPGLAILDGGKRDFPYDEGMPTSPHGEVVKLNDQHAFLRTDSVGVGHRLRLGLSHPCTAFDKWRLIPVVDDADVDDPTVVDLVRTFF
ncbi:MAG: alanine racemase [Rhodoglobus sp.]|nr:alanine racemase [Rhodoglobus sp.]